MDQKLSVSQASRADQDVNNDIGAGTKRKEGRKPREAAIAMNNRDDRVQNPEDVGGWSGEREGERGHQNPREHRLIP